MVTEEQRLRLQRRADQGPPPYVWHELERIAGRSITERLRIQSAVGAFLDYCLSGILDPRSPQLRTVQQDWSELFRRQAPGRTTLLTPEQKSRLQGWWRSIGKSWWRRHGIDSSALRPKGRPSVAGLDRLIRVLDRYFPELECRKDTHQNPDRYSGRFIELMYEVLRQTKPVLLIGGVELAGINVTRWNQNPRDKQLELNYIGRRIKEVRRRTRK